MQEVRSAGNDSKGLAAWIQRQLPRSAVGSLLTAAARHQPSTLWPRRPACSARRSATTALRSGIMSGVGNAEEGWDRGTGGCPMSTYLLPALRPPRAAWNKGRIIGQKRPLQPKHVWSIRVRLEMADNRRDLALFNLAVDS